MKTSAARVIDLDPGNHRLACARIKVAALGNLLPTKYLEKLEQDQQIAHCCRHPENHDIEAWFSNPKDAAAGTPDIYIFHCTCGRKHTRFCVGTGDIRPFWESR
jgi:hypothetical protein